MASHPIPKDRGRNQPAILFVRLRSERASAESKCRVYCGVATGVLLLLGGIAGATWAAEPPSRPVSDGPRIAAQHFAVFSQPPQHVPTATMPDGPLLGNGDVGVVLAGPPEDQRFLIGKNDFWRRTDASIMAVGSIRLSIPALRGATYRQEQDPGLGEVRGTFSKDGATVQTRSWVEAGQNLLVTSLSYAGGPPLAITVRQSTGAPAAVPTQVSDNDRRLNIGREQHGNCRWYFDGTIDGVRVYERALTAAEIRALAAGQTVNLPPLASWPQDSAPGVRITGGAAAEGKIGRTIRFDGRQTYVETPVRRLSQAVTVAAWIKIEGTSPEANYVVSKGEWNQAYSLGLSNGRLRWAVGATFAQMEKPLELKKWLHVAGTFDGRQLSAYVDGVAQVTLGELGGAGTIDQRLAASVFTRRADSLPGSREVAVATRLVGSEVKADEAGGLHTTLAPGASVSVVSAIVSDLDDKDFLATAKRRVEQLTPPTLEPLSRAHRQRWADFWSRSFIEIPDKQLERHWYAALYVLGSCSRAGKVAPGLWGNWVTTDHPAWHGDFHLNYNFQAPYYLVYSSNHADLSRPFYQAILESVPNGRAMAKRHGWKGVHFPVSIGPWGLSPEDPDGDWGQRSNASFAALNFIWHYQYTQDADFLRRTAYPYLREVADFWEDYLKLENGRYVIHNDSIHEGSGKDLNPLLSLGLVRTLFKNLIPMSRDLNVDAERRAKWQDICERLSEFPIQERAGKTVFRYSEQGTAWWGDNTLGIHHIFPAGAIGLDSAPRLLEISRQTIDAMARWHDNNGFSSWYTACARVAYPADRILAGMRAECERCSFPNLVLNYGGGGIENVAGFLALNELLLQSHEGVIRLFPVWPSAKNARFGGLRAVGAFLVSAEMQDGVVGDVRIVSEQGRDCTVQNPWPGCAVQLVRNGQAAEVASGARLQFKTAPGETLLLARKRDRFALCAAPSGPFGQSEPVPLSVPIAAASEIDTLAKLWEGFDPRALPLDVVKLKEWEEDDIHLEMLYFTGEVFGGEPTRIFGYVGRPKREPGKVPGILHIHGGGQTANLAWPRFWAKRGYVCLSFDFCGNTNLPTLGPEYRREHYTKWGQVPANMMQVGGGTQMTPTPRHNPWFHWTLAARRGLTLLEQQPEVDGAKLGIFGVSVGGTLTWIVAGVDDRVRAAAPIYGCGWESYAFPPQPEAAIDNEKRLWRALIAPETHAPRITCPVLFLSATNDGHGKMDLAYKTLDLLKSPLRSQVFTANYDHHVEPAESKSLARWMDTHLRGAAGAWPATPNMEVVGSGVPQIRLVPAAAAQVQRVDLYYCLNNDWPMSRFWRTVNDVRREGEAYLGPAPFMSASDVLYVFGNVTYASGVRISSRLLRKAVAELPGATPSLKKTALVDAMDTATDWNWIPAYTDPSQEDGAYFTDWKHPSGHRGFTLDPQRFNHQGPMSYYFGTRKLGDPQFSNEGQATLLLDCWSESVPEQLTIRVAWREPGTNGDEFSSAAALERLRPMPAQAAAVRDASVNNSGGSWRTLRLERQQFQNQEGRVLPDWKQVYKFILVGTNRPGQPPVFKQLRWE